MTSRLAVRIAGLVLAIGVVWYITSLNAEIARLRAASSQPPGAADRAASAPAAAPAPAPAAPVAAREITPEQRTAMLEKLGTTPGSPVWFRTVPNNPEAASFQKALGDIFKEAGWQVHESTPIRFAMKPGIFVFAADEEPPLYLTSVNDALEAAGFTITSGRGYRDFVRQKKEENPNWVGLELADEETYVIAIGRAG